MTASDTITRLHRWISDVGFDDLPPDVRAMAARCVLDLAGTAAAGAETRLSAIVRDHAVQHFAAGPGSRAARILFDGRPASAAGAALAGGMTIDSIDAHDGHVLTKGHAGAAVLPGLLAVLDTAETSASGPELLTALVVGYEVAIRAGISLHATAPDYHTSGAWNALGVAAVAGRLWKLDREQFRHALGIAEYHGPRSQMMRCIDHPTMLKDGSGWGAMTGVSSAALAQAGFTGAPALTVEEERTQSLWDDVGERWRILEMYFKPYPVCRWGQPAIEAALQVRAVHQVDPATIDEVEVVTFHEATRLDQHQPASTEEAQYSLPFPVAAALVRGHLVPEDIAETGLVDPDVVAMSHRITLVDDPGLSSRFPVERLASVRLRLRDGTVLASDTLPARGDAEAPLDDEELDAKFRALAGGPLGSRAGQIHELVAELEYSSDARPLLDLLLAPLPR
jgi:2-methylcitrate dehydratase PrpD